VIFPYFSKEAHLTMTPDVLKIINKTHLILRLISLTQVHQALARKALTFITVRDRSLQQLGAVFFEEGADLVSWTTTSAVWQTALPSFVCGHREVGTANSAIHTTGSYERDFVRRGRFH
jgi:hypothetical protein